MHMHNNIRIQSLIISHLLCIIRLISLLVKPPEMASWVVMSRLELVKLFLDIRTAVEASGQGLGSPFFVQICSFLAANDGVPADNVEYLLQIPVRQPDATDPESGSRLAPLPSDHDSVPGRAGGRGGGGGGGGGDRGDGSLSHTPSGISLAYRYQQLSHGLELATKYEETLVRILKRIESRQRTSLYDLVEDEAAELIKAEPDGVLRPEDDASKFLKHTAASKKKIAEAHFGLEKMRKARLIPSKRPDSWEHVSRRSLENEMFASYRFGTPSLLVNAGTSMGRHNGCFAPILPPSATAPAGRNNFSSNGSVAMASTRSKYTKFDVPADRLGRK